MKKQVIFILSLLLFILFGINSRAQILPECSDNIARYRVTLKFTRPIYWQHRYQVNVYLRNSNFDLPNPDDPFFFIDHTAIPGVPPPNSFTKQIDMLASDWLQHDYMTFNLLGKRDGILGPGTGAEFIYATGDNVPSCINNPGTILGGAICRICEANTILPLVNGTGSVSLPNDLLARRKCNVAGGLSGNDMNDVFPAGNQFLTYEAIPLTCIINQPADGTIGCGANNAIQLHATPGFRPSEYQWLYTLDNGANWTNLTAATGSDPSITMNQIPGAVFGKSIKFILKRTVNSGNAAAYSAPSIPYTFWKPTPTATDIAITRKPTCDAPTGNVAITFDRPLLPQERIALTARNSANGASFNIDDIGSLTSATGVFNWNNQLEAGSYNLEITGYDRVTNNRLCNAVSVPFIVPDKQDVAFTTIPTAVSCNGKRDGNIQVTLTNPNPAKQFVCGYINYVSNINDGNTVTNWQPIVNGVTTLTGLAANKYVVVVKEDVHTTTACYIKQIVDVTSPDALQVNTLTVTRVPDCGAGANKGSITIEALGGTTFTNNTYQYEWRAEGQPTILSTTQNFEGPQGNYVVTVIDKNNCTVNGVINVIEAPFGSVYSIDSYEVKSPICFGGSNGEINITKLEGDVLPPPYEYKINNGNYSTSSLFTGLSAGTYTITVRNTKQCLATKDVTIDNPTQYTINLGIDKPICLGSIDNLTANVAPSTPITSYQWFDNNGILTGKTAATLQIKSIDIGSGNNYRVDAITDKGCLVQDDINVTLGTTKIEADFLVSSQAYANEKIQAVNISKDVDEVVWQLPTDATIISSNNRFVEFVLNMPNKYTIKMKGIKNVGCETFVEKDIIITQPMALPTSAVTRSSAFKTDGIVIMPNPNNGSFTLQVEVIENVQASLYMIDMLSGRLVKDLNKRNFQKNIKFRELLNTGLSVGKYILVIETSKERKVLKVDIQ